MPAVQGVPQPVKVSVAILLIEEARPAIVATLHDVQRYTINVDARTSGHKIGLEEIEPGLFFAWLFRSGKLGNETNIGRSLRAMRAVCRKFLDTVGTDERILRFGADHGHFASWEFIGAVGQPRGVFGIHLAQIAAQYGLDIEGELASIIPGQDSENET